MTKIAYIGPSGVFGGVRALVEHCNRLSARGHDVTYLNTDNAVINWLPCNFPQRPAQDPGGPYDVIVGSAIATWPGVLELARKMGARSSAVLQMAEWLFAPHGSEQYNKTLADFTTPLDSVMAISEWLAKLSEQVTGRATIRIRNGIDTRLFYPQPFPDAPPFDGLTICTEGVSANLAKDTDEMTLRAIRKLRYDDGGKVRVFGFSQYPQPSEIFNRYWTQPPQHIIRMIYSTSDIFLKASRYEGRPGPDMEAMACGAVVNRAIGAGDDDLIDGDNCLKVQYGDFDGYYSNLRRLLDDPELRAQLRSRALAYAQRYDWDGAIDLVEETLTGAVSHPLEEQRSHAYELSAYNSMQQTIVEWETPQAMFLGRTLADMFHPKSVIDIGCGPGVYLIPFKPEASVLGVDGSPKAGQALEPGEFVSADFRHDWRLPIEHDGDGPKRFDLAMCIEVAEHLPPDRADYLVSLLTSAAPLIFFSAAQPGQGGTLHLNEQPREYWLEKFAARGYNLHSRNDELSAAIAANPHCQRVQWLIGNAMLLGKHEPTETTLHHHAHRAD